MKLPRRLSRDLCGEAPREFLDGDKPRGEPPRELALGERPRGGDAPRTNTSSSAGSGMEANLAGAKTCVGCRKAPPRPLTTRCSGSYGCRLAQFAGCGGGCAGGAPARRGGIAYDLVHARTTALV